MEQGRSTILSDIDHQYFRLSVLVVIGVSIRSEGLCGDDSVLFSMPTTFISSYLVIYILTPVINKALSVFDRSEYRYLLIVLLGYFCIAATFLFQTTWHYMGWAFTLYCVGGYIRKYELTSLNWKFGWISLGLLAMLWGAILFLIIWRPVSISFLPRSGLLRLRMRIRSPFLRWHSLFLCTS